MSTALERVLAKEPRVETRPAPRRARAPWLLVPIALGLVGASWSGVEGSAPVRRLLLLSLLGLARLRAGAQLRGRRPHEPLGAVLLAPTTATAAGIAAVAASGAWAE